MKNYEINNYLTINKFGDTYDQESPCIRMKFSFKSQSISLVIENDIVNDILDNKPRA